jgi:predicted ATPase
MSQPVASPVLGHIRFAGPQVAYAGTNASKLPLMVLLLSLERFLPPVSARSWSLSTCHDRLLPTHSGRWRMTETGYMWILDNRHSTNQNSAPECAIWSNADQWAGWLTVCADSTSDRTARILESEPRNLRRLRFFPEKKQGILMLTDLRSIDYEQPLSLLIGENGSGKSQALADIAEAYISKSYRVIAIANCPFDKFREKGKHYHFMGGRYGQSFVSIALQKIIESIQEPSASRYHIGKVLSYLGYDPQIGICQDKSEAQVDWHDVSMSHSSDSHRSLSKNGRWTLNQSKGELHNWPAIFLTKNGYEFPLERASSGEIQLLTTLAFIASHISERTVILIDEPENSLHPRWQRSYIDRLFDLFQSSEPKVIIATHAPVMVTAASNCGLPFQLYQLRDNTPQQVSCRDESMEQVLWDVFKVLTPRSAFLSRYMADLLHQVQLKEMAQEVFDHEFNELHEAARYDRKQQELIERARELIQ